MFHWFRELDRVLRGDATRLKALERGTVEVPLFGLSIVIILLGMVYGACMGTFALLRDTGPSYDQFFASMVKVPALFFLTLIVTYPSLYVFNALVGSRLGAASVLRLLIASLGVNLAVLSSLGPIVAFFSVCTTSYAFMVLLNVTIFAVAGLLGLNFLLQTLHRLTVSQQIPPWIPPEEHQPADEAAVETEPNPQGPENTDAIGALERLEQYALASQVKAVFRCWVFVFGIVGVQMAWLLRPFIGNPTQEFQWFRARESNFFEAVWNTLQSLLLG